MSFSPLCLPEILLPVFEHLGVDYDTESLMNASLVNHTWFQQATDVLWRKAELKFLVRVEPCRRQMYASKICRLIFFSTNKRNAGYLSRLKNVRFSRLKFLHSDMLASDEGDTGCIGQFLQPSLEDLRLWNGKTVDCLLNCTSFELPRLQKICIGGDYGGYEEVSDSVISNRFIGLLENIPSLTSIIILGSIGQVITDQTLKYFVNRQNLVELDLSGRLFRQAAIEDAISLATHPFKNVYMLEMRVESHSVPCLIRAILNGPIKDLVLEIEDDKNSILDLVSEVAQLQSIQIRYNISREIPQQEIMSLRNLDQLQKLELTCHDEDEDLLSFDMENGDLQQLTAHLKKLQEFRFLVQCNLSVGAIVGIAKSCPTLKKLALSGEYNLQALAKRKKVLFPALTELQLGNARIETSRLRFPKAKSIFAILLNHMPELEFLQLHERNKFTEKLEGFYNDF